MQALISPNEGNRICQIAVDGFPVASPLYWIKCPDDCAPSKYTFDGAVFTLSADLSLAATTVSAAAPLPSFATADALAAYLRSKGWI